MRCGTAGDTGQWSRRGHQGYTLVFDLIIEIEILRDFRWSSWLDPAWLCCSWYYICWIGAPWMIIEQRSRCQYWWVSLSVSLGGNEVILISAPARKFLPIWTHSLIPNISKYVGHRSHGTYFLAIQFYRVDVSFRMESTHCCNKDGRIGCCGLYGSSSPLHYLFSAVWLFWSSRVCTTIMAIVKMRGSRSARQMLAPRSSLFEYKGREEERLSQKERLVWCVLSFCLSVRIVLAVHFTVNANRRRELGLALKVHVY